MKRLLIRNLVKRYRYFELLVENLIFTEGINLVIGSNGSGKSTLLKLIAGFISPSRGEVLYEENGLVKTTREITSKIGYVGEDLILPHRKIKDILSELLDKDRLSEVVSLLGLQDYLQKKYLELSSGYRKRVQLAIALGKESEVLLLDEPFSNLDIFAIKTLKEVLRKINDKVIVLTSHIALGMEASTLTILDQGKVLYYGESLTNKRVMIVKVNGKDVELNMDEFNKMMADYNVQIVKVLEIEDILNRLITKGRRK